MSNNSLLDLREPFLDVLDASVEFLLFLCISKLSSLLLGRICQFLPLHVQFLQAFIDFWSVLWFLVGDVVSRL